MPDGPIEEAFARSISEGLLPQPFPLRREVEFAAARHGTLSRIGFYDTWWLDGDAVVFLAASLPAGGLRGAMSAAAERQLLRAAIGEVREPKAALDACRHLLYPGMGLAILLLHTSSGMARTAFSGDGGIFEGQGLKVRRGSFALASGATLWLTAGPRTLSPLPDDNEGRPVEELVHLARHDLQAGAAIALIRFKGADRMAEAETVSIRNDLHDIAKVIERLQAFCTRNSVDDQAADGLDLALDEVLTNLISYGFRDGARHTVDVAFAIFEEHLTIEVRDDGIPFNPLDIPPPALEGGIDERRVGGLGMHFVRSVADDITYRRQSGWNILRLSRAMDRSASNGGAGK